jgi:acyl carrier protein
VPVRPFALSTRGGRGYILPIFRVTTVHRTQHRTGDEEPPARRDVAAVDRLTDTAPGRSPGAHAFAARRAAQEDRHVPSVKDRVIEIVCENLGVNKEQVTEKTSFIEDVGADSLDIVELIMELEEEFEINIPDEQAEKIKTVGEAIEYIEREIAKK